MGLYVPAGVPGQVLRLGNVMHIIHVQRAEVTNS
jgi:hypothetical protein